MSTTERTITKTQVRASAEALGFTGEELDSITEIRATPDTVEVTVMNRGDNGEFLIGYSPLGTNLSVSHHSYPVTYQDPEAPE